LTVSIKNNSRLHFADLLTIDAFEFWDLTEFPEIPTQNDDILHQIQGPERIDNLAHTYYSDPILWWVIAVANGLEIVPTNFQVGDIVRIPSPRYVTQILLPSGRRRI
jgi:hypothetical protein